MSSAKQRWRNAPPAKLRSKRCSGTAERLYTQIVLAANNERLPPPWTPTRFLRYLRWAWLIEGGVSAFSRQVDFYRGRGNPPVA